MGAGGGVCERVLYSQSPHPHFQRRGQRRGAEVRIATGAGLKEKEAKPHLLVFLRGLQNSVW